MEAVCQACRSTPISRIHPTSRFELAKVGDSVQAEIHACRPLEPVAVLCRSRLGRAAPASRAGLKLPG